MLRCSVTSDSFVAPMGCSPPLSMGFSRQEYWSGYFLLQRIFPTQGSNLGILHCRWILYHLSHQGSKVKSLSRVWLFATPQTVAYQAPLSMGFSKQEYWSGLPFPSPRDLPDPGIEPRSPALQTNALRLSHQGSPPLISSLPVTCVH